MIAAPRSTARRSDHPSITPSIRRNAMTIASRSTSDEDGSLVTEYGLLAVVAATIAGVLIQWATSGALINLFNALIDRARALVGA
jgi:Flp pilus assembly pilin Flp